jgi:nitrate reductase alpha subunit
MSVDTTTTSTLRTDLKWIGTHLIILTVVVGLAGGLVYEFEGLLEKHDLATEAKYNSLLAAQAQQNQTDLATLEAHYTQLEQLTQAAMKQNTELSQTIANEKTALSQQEQQNATLTAQQAAADLAEQTNAKAGEIVAGNDIVTVDMPIARQLVDNNDALVATQSELTNTQTQLTNETSVANSAQSTVTQQTTVIAGLQKQNTEQVAACTAEVAAINKKNKRSMIKRILIAVGVGIGIGFKI